MLREQVTNNFNNSAQSKVPITNWPLSTYIEFHGMLLASLRTKRTRSFLTY